MINIYTCTEQRTEIAELWSAALSRTLTDEYKAIIYYQLDPPLNIIKDKLIQIERFGQMACAHIIRKYIVNHGIRLFLEEDMIPIIPWSVSDYPGDLLFAEGCDNHAWPALTLIRKDGPLGPINKGSFKLVHQRFINDGGCPDWLPSELCQLAMDANIKILGNHFIHLDKMYNTNIPKDMSKAKNELLKLLRKKFIQ